MGVWHHGIVHSATFLLGYGIRATVIRNAKGRGVAISDWKEFSEGQTVFFEQRADSPMHVQAILRRATSKLGQPYMLLAADMMLGLLAGILANE